MDTTRHKPELAALNLTPPWTRGLRWRVRMGLRWAIVTLVAFLLTAAAVIAVLHPSGPHAAAILLWLAVSGVVSLALGEVSLCLADALRIGGVRLKLVLPSLLTALVIAVNVVLVAGQMFISTTDEQLVLAFLVFGIAVALVVAASNAGEMTAAIARIEAGARRISAGDYSFRLAGDDPGGAQELSHLAQWFNQMAASVQAAFEQRAAADVERRRVVAAVSHDLRTPLTSLRALIEAIDDGVVTDPAVVVRYHRTMRAEMRYLTVLLDDLFELSRLDSGALALHREAVSLGDLISDVLEGNREAAEQTGVRLSGRIEGELPDVWVDVRQVYRVLANLVHNALRHTPPCGEVLIQACERPTDAGEGDVLVSVVDTGEGIAPDDLPHIFDRAFRSGQSRMRDPVSYSGLVGSGSGLGLSIARGIVEAHGGRIWADSPAPPELRALVDVASADPGLDMSWRGAVLSFTLPTCVQSAVECSRA
jgi:signal transduction histidine kinase